MLSAFVWERKAIRKRPKNRKSPQRVNKYSWESRGFQTENSRGTARGFCPPHVGEHRSHGKDWTSELVQ